MLFRSRIKYGEAFANDLATKLGGEQKAAPKTAPKEPTEPVVQKQSQKAQKYNNLQIGNDGQIYDVRPDGQAVRVNLVEGGIPAFPWGASANEKTIKMGNKTYENPKYKEFLEKLKELGLYEEYAERFGIR